MTSLLFVYGTLLQSDNEFARYLQQNCAFVSKGTINGQLYDLGEYPGLVLSVDGDQLVHGSIYDMTHPDAILKCLDEYEGVDAGEEQPDLYRRETHKVKTTNKALDAWVYVYNRPIFNPLVVPGGDYLAYINKKSLRF